MKKRKNVHVKIDNQLLELIEQYENEQLSPTELAIELGKTVKTQGKKK